MFEQWLQPQSSSSQGVIEILELHQLAYDFHREQAAREAWHDYCQRYARLAEQNRAEHAVMQSELNLLRLFYRICPR